MRPECLAFLDARCRPARVLNNSAGAGATALELRVEPGKAPMKVNSATRVALLNSEKVGGKDATAFYAAGSKVADSELLDGKNSTELAGANHNHDSSYIQQSPTSAESASININGTLRTSGMLCTG